MMHYQLICSILCVLLAAICAAQNQPEVTLPTGPIRGYLKKSYNGRTYSAFEGIPYAKPPIGPLRFSAPQPIEPWTNVLNATKNYICPQVNLMQPDMEYGQEDCLYINVYVPREVPDANERLAVMVNIHGGAFTIGSATMYNSEDYLMDKDVIWVAMNYRLGILGFLSTGDDVAPGNFGLKDQVLALKWVQQNIASFGGNPDSVTLSGESSGADNAHLHYFSPLSKGLFHRGITHSGTAFNAWSVQKDPTVKAKRLAVLSGCPEDNSLDLVECLRKVPADELTLKNNAFMEFHAWLFLPFTPVIENGPNAFLTESPFELVKQKKVLDVPWVTSTMQDEGLYFVLTITPNLEELNEKWLQFAQIIAFYNYTIPEESWNETADAIREFYFHGGNISVDSIPEFSQMFTDRFFVTGGESAASYHAAAVTSPVYYYNFNYKGVHSATQSITGDNSVLGTTHGDDVLYIYTPNYLNSSVPLSAEDIQMKDLFIDFMVEYAQTGIVKFADVEWKPVTQSEFSYLNISSTTDIKMETRQIGNREFWDGLGLLDVYN